MAKTADVHHPEWVYVHIGQVQGQNTFASCYRCGGLCQPDTYRYGEAERIGLVQTFCDEHCACRPVATRRHGGEDG